MTAQTTEGTGPGSAADIKPKIYNGVVKDVNIARNALDSYKGLIIVDKDNESETTYQLDGSMTATGSISTDSGLHVGNNLSVDGYIDCDSYVRGHALGSYLNTSFYTFNSGDVSNSSNTYTDFASVSYTPVSNSSFLMIEYHAPYTVSGGGGDNFRSIITIGATEVTYRTQVWANGVGGGSRSSVLFPISMVSQNSVTSALTIKVSAARNGSDDTLTVDTNGAYLKVIEIAR